MWWREKNKDKSVFTDPNHPQNLTDKQEDRIEELETDKYWLKVALKAKEGEIEKLKNFGIKQSNQLKEKNDQIKKWNKLGRFISSIPFDSKQNLVPERGIELIKDLLKRANRPM